MSCPVSDHSRSRASSHLIDDENNHDLALNDLSAEMCFFLNRHGFIFRFSVGGGGGGEG